MALPAGFIADKFLGGATGGMRLGLLLVALFSLVMTLLPTGGDYTWLAMITMTTLALLFFFMRALYFAPFGEMGLPQRFSGSVIAIAAFIIYLPSSFAYLLWGWLLDNYPGASGYHYMFGALALVSTIGMAIGHLLQRRIRTGASERIAKKVLRMDQALGLHGDEKILSDLIDARSRDK